MKKQTQNPTQQQEPFIYHPRSVGATLFVNGCAGFLTAFNNTPFSHTGNLSFANYYALYLSFKTMLICSPNMIPKLLVSVSSAASYWLGLFLGEIARSALITEAPSPTLAP